MTSELNKTKSTKIYVQGNAASKYGLISMLKWNRNFVNHHNDQKWSRGLNVIVGALH